AERLGPRLHEFEAHSVQVVLPAGDDVAELRQGIRPLVWALESPVVCDAWALRDGLALRRDVDLLAPVGLAQRELAADAGVPPEVRALHVLARQLAFDGEGADVAGGG